MKLHCIGEDIEDESTRNSFSFRIICILYIFYKEMLALYVIAARVLHYMCTSVFIFTFSKMLINFYKTCRKDTTSLFLSFLLFTIDVNNIVTC
jgi:hypothetical protein